ncbi:MAG TPA: hypothetical protein VM754_01180, partial [Actinomycetota bacterium]|nr:hypothetical protein [Actinomycetota bacterium]
MSNSVGRRPEANDRTDGRRATLACIGVLATVALAIYWRHLFGGYGFPHDYRATSRWPVFITNTLTGGHFTEWIPFAGGGQPLPYNAASGMYFPVWWVLGALNVPTTLPVVNFVQAAHVFLGGAGVFVLGRTLGLGRRWALFAGLAFLFFGGHYSNGFHDLIVRSNAYAPWLLYSLTPPAGNRGWMRVLGLPFWMWMLVGGGYPGQAMAFLQMGAVYLVIHLWFARTR